MRGQQFWSDNKYIINFNRLNRLIVDAERVSMDFSLANLALHASSEFILSPMN